MSQMIGKEIWPQHIVEAFRCMFDQGYSPETISNYLQEAWAEHLEERKSFYQSWQKD